MVNNQNRCEYYNGKAFFKCPCCGKFALRRVSGTAVKCFYCAAKKGNNDEINE